MIPKLAYPFRVTHGRVATVEQDSPDDIAACVRVILSTEVGSRLEEPTFGIPSPLFRRQPPDVQAMTQAVAEWDDRAAADITGTIDTVDALTARVAVSLEGTDG